MPAGWRTLVGLLIVALAGCSTPHLAQRGESVRWELTEGDREAVVNAARSFLGRAHIQLNHKRYGDDCTGLVRAVFDSVDVNLLADAQPGDNGVTAIYRFAEEHGRLFQGGHALPGDLVFFRDTYDRNRDGRDDDGLTHVGIVESIDPDGTVSVIHHVRRGVVRYRMNLAYPTARRHPTSGETINDYLRPAHSGKGPVLTAALFASYATLFIGEPVARR